MPQPVSPGRSASLAGVTASYEAGNLDAAIVQLQRLLERAPDDAQLHFMLGNALYRRGAFQQAADAYARALTLRPLDAETHVSRGFALYELGDCPQAVRDWTHAAIAYPDEPLARAALAVGLYCVGEFERASKEYRAAIALDPRYSTSHALRVDIRWKDNTVVVLDRLRDGLPNKK